MSTSSRRLPRVALVTLLLGLAACGSKPVGFDDGGLGADGGGVLPDGGPTLVDGGPQLMDGGAIPLDGGPTRDGGPSDGGVMVDLGRPCSLDADCPGGFCITEEESGWQSGYCSMSCGANNACPAGGTCYSRFNVCLRTCNGDECRAGYTCSERLAMDVLPSRACVPGRAGARPGDPCTLASQCSAGGYCLTEAQQGYPGGYCSSLCTPNRPNSCGDGLLCATFENDQGAQATCLRRCGQDSDCRTPGYVCETRWFGVSLDRGACVPGTREVRPVGSPCATQGQCTAGSFCLTADDGFPGGYCTQLCGDNMGTCPGRSFCEADIGVCLAQCGADSDCRGTGWTCARELAGLTLSQNTCVPFRPNAQLGDACRRFNDCTVGGYCLPPVDEQGDPTPFTGGYCSRSCSAQLRCPAGGYCIDFGDFETCAKQCSADTQCRTAERYTCQPFPGVGQPNDSACLPPL